MIIVVEFFCPVFRRFLLLILLPPSHYDSLQDFCIHWNRNEHPLNVMYEASNKFKDAKFFLKTNSIFLLLNKIVIMQLQTQAMQSGLLKAI